VSARGRRDNNAELQKDIEDYLATNPTGAEATEALDRERVASAPVLTLNQAMKHPHLNERKTLRWISDP